MLPLVPLDLRGTPFQLKVWDALRRIPAGRTTAYGALASKLGGKQGKQGLLGKRRGWHGLFGRGLACLWLRRVPVSMRAEGALAAADKRECGVKREKFFHGGI